MLLVVAPGWTLAQDTGTITGVVTDSTNGGSIPGANVVIQSLSVGAATNSSGSFEIPSVPEGEYTVTASFVGFVAKSKDVTVEAGQTTSIDFALAPETVDVGEVVVTALGVERSARSVSNSVQQVQGDDLAQVENNNFVNSLQGRIAGASIKSSSTMGGSSNIVLRGVSSLTGNNQPLIVIDGIPIDNSTTETDGGQAAGGGGFDYGNAASIINPNNVKSVSILKGPSAAALYGSRGSNGVIQITTKSGADREGLGVSFSSGIQVMRAYEFMDYQNEYGGGAPGSTFRTVEGNDFRLDSEDDQWVADYATDESWGPRLDGRNVRQWYSWDDVNGLNGQTTPWEANPNNVQDFLNTGTRFSTDLSMSQGGDTFNYRLNLSNINMSGVMPNSELDRYQFGFNGSADLSDRLTATAVARYTYDEAKGRSGTGYGFAENAFAQFNTFGQRQVDLGEGSYMYDYARPGRIQRGWNFAGIQGAQTGTFQYTDNPYVGRFENFQTDDSQRLFGKAQINYAIQDDLGASFLITTDHRTERRSERIAKISSEESDYTEDLLEVQEVNSEIKLDYATDLSSSFDFDGFVASRVRWETFERNRQSTASGLASAEVYTIENSVGRPNVIDLFEQNAVYAVYGSANVGYNDLLYLTGTLRNDWSSTLPADNNSYLYPSLSSSFVFSSLDALQGLDFLSFGKLRASIARVGNDTDPYRLSTVYPGELPFNGQPLLRVQRDLNNPELEPEITTGYEIGTELEFFQNRASLDVTYYRDETRNQILPLTVSPASGYESALVNAGKILNQGVEVQLGGTPVLTDDFRWDMSANWATNNGEILELREGTDSYVINAGAFGPNVEARVGQPYGAIYGTALVRNDAGEVVYTESGVPRATQDQQVIGNYQPDWTAGVSTRFSYKGVSLSALVEGQKGGDIWSLSNTFGTYSGLLEETVTGNQRETGVVPDGVVETDNGYQPFGEAVGAISSAAYWKNNFFGPSSEIYLYDASYIKLQELVISYTLPQKWFANTPVQRLNLSATGRNLALLYKKAPNIDPSLTLSAGNFQGYEAGQIPPQRQFGFRINMLF